jgi:capsular polysaccharide biosynthesis protein
VTEEEEYVLSLGDVFRVLRRRLWAILLVALACVGLAVGLSLAATPQYEGTVRILIGQREQGGQASGSLGSDVQGLEQLTQTMVAAVDSEPVAEAVIRRLDLRTDPQDFLDNMTVQQVPNTQFIQVSYTDPSPENASRIANTIGEVFSNRVSEISPSANAVTATVWSQARVPDSPVSPNYLRNCVLALMIGLVLGVGLAFLLEYLDDSWRSPEEAERISGVPVFGMVPEFGVPKGKKG